MDNPWPIGVGLSVAWLAAGCTGSQSYELRFNPKLGETYAYRATIARATISGVANTAYTFSMKPVREDAAWVVFESRLSDVTLNGQPLPAAANELVAGMVITSTFKRSGQFVRNQVAGVPERLSEQLRAKHRGGTTITFSDDPVKIGDTWNGATMLEGHSAITTFKFIRNESVGGKQAADLEATFDRDEYVTLARPTKKYPSR